MKFCITIVPLISTVLASQFIAYQGNYYTGANADVSNCGCNSIPYNGSYKWYAQGQSGRMFNSDNCQGEAQTTLSSSDYTEMTTGFGWQSIDIIC